MTRSQHRPLAGTAQPTPHATPPGPGPVAVTVTATDIEHARGLMREVCSLASTAIGMSGDSIAARDDDDGVDALQTRIRILHLFIDRIGWVADVGLRKLGDSGSFARAEDWMLPGV